MNGRFKNDVAKVKCKDGKIREAIIVNDHGNSTFDVAYIQSYGCKNVQVFHENGISERKFVSATLDKNTILPYEVGDLVEYHLNPEDYYMAHIVEVGKYNTVKVLLGDLYMKGWVKDDKKDDIVEASVSDLKWIDHAKKHTRENLIKYGYQPEELRKLENQGNIKLEKTKNKTVKNNVTGEEVDEGRFIGACAIVAAICILLAIVLSPVIIQSAKNTKDEVPYPDNTNAIAVTDEGYHKPELVAADTNLPVRAFVEKVYAKYYDDITVEELNAITHVSISVRDMDFESENGKEYEYTFTYQVDDGEEYSIDLNSHSSFDGYTFEELKGIKYLKIDTDLLKNVEFIEKMPELKTLKLEHTGVRDLSVLEKSSIENLSLRRNEEIQSLSFLSGMENLKELTIDSIENNLDDITEELENVEVLHADVITDFSFTKYMPKLREFYYGYRTVTTKDLDLTEIYKKDTVEEIHLNNLSSYNEDYTELFNMKNLKTLEMKDSMVAVRFSSINKNESLKNFSVDNTKFLSNVDVRSDGFISYINYDESYLGEHMEILTQFPNLRKLSLIGEKVDSTEYISELEYLEELDLTDNYISDIGELKSLNSLKKLTIRNNSLGAPVTEDDFVNNVEIIQ